MSGPFGSSSFNHLTSSGFYNNVINQSLRLRVGGNYKLDRQMVTPTSVTGTICTASWWMKKTARGTVQSFIQCRDNQSSGEYDAYWTYGVNTSGNLAGADHHSFRSGGSESVLIGSLNSHKPYDDPNGWYHVVIRYDSTQSTAADRIRIYKNGELQNGTFQGTTYPSQNATSDFWNNAGEHLILFGNGEDSGDTFDGYVAEFNWVDGQSLPPETFGESKNGIWIPKEITLTASDYGLNGSRYTFADGSDIGKDTSGVGNDLDRVDNLGAQHIMLDTPENSFAILNPRIRLYDANSTFANGALTHISNSTGVTSQAHSSLAVRQDAGGKWYAECRLNAFTNGSTWIGVVRDVPKLSNGLFVCATRSNGYAYKTDGNKTTSDNNGSSYGNSYTAGDVIGIALDLDNNQIFFYKNGTIQNSGTAAFTSISAQNFATDDTSQHFVFGADTDPGNNFTFNFGADSTFHGYETAGGNSDANGIGDFAYAVPTGFLACCSSNLSDTTIGPNSASQSDDFFNSVLWTGNASTRSITGVGFQPDLVWIKPRSDTDNHVLLDTPRGGTKYLMSNRNDGQISQDPGITSFDTDGFSIGNWTNVNQNTETYVAWSWIAGGAPSADNSAGAGNTPTANSVKIDGSNLGSALAGTIPATRLTANTTSGFSIVTYTGTGTQSDTVAHGLGKAPAWYMTKSLSEAQNWHVYHEEIDASAPENYILPLNAQNAKSSSSANFWNSTAPTTSVVSVGDDNSSNKSSTTYVMYCYAEIDGFSKFGKHEGNNSSSDGQFIFTGFRPAWLMVKNIDTAGEDWHIFDNKRAPSNVMKARLIANENTQENTNDNIIDFVSNGFKWRDNNAGYNSSATFIYFAFAETPFKYANAR